MSNNTKRFPTTFNPNRAAAEVAALLILDDTAEVKLSEAEQFANFQRKLDADRAAVQARFATKRTDAQRFARLAAAL